MQMCYQHPKLEAVAHCRRCRLPACCHCIEDLYCPDCIKLQRYMALGHSGPRKPQLIETPKRRSVTMELMIQRLERQAFDPDAASLNPARQAPVRKAKSSIKTGVKTQQGLSYGLLMPGIAPLIKVSRSPISRFAALAVVAFSLGVFFSQTRTTYAEPAPVAEAPYEEDYSEPVAPPIEVRTHYKPVYIYVDTPQAARPATRPPTPAPTMVPRALIGYAPAIAPAQPPSPPRQAPSQAAAEPELDESLASLRSNAAPDAMPEEVLPSDALAPE